MTTHHDRQSAAALVERARDPEVDTALAVFEVAAAVAAARAEEAARWRAAIAGLLRDYVDYRLSLEDFVLAIRALLDGER